MDSILNELNTFATQSAGSQSKPKRAEASVNFGDANPQKIIPMRNQAKQPFTNLQTSVVAWYNKNSGPRDDTVTVSNLNEALMEVFSTCNPEEIFSFMRCYKSLPFMGTESAIRSQEATNKTLSVDTGRNEDPLSLMNQRKRIVEMYITVCQKGGPGSKFSELQYKGNWTQFANTEVCAMICKSLQPMLMNAFPASKDLGYLKIMFVHAPISELASMINFRFICAAKLILRHLEDNDIKMLPKGSAIPGTKFTTASKTMFWTQPKDFGETTQPSIDSDKDTWTDADLLAGGAFLDWRFLLNRIDIHTPTDVKENVIKVVGTGIKTMFMQFDSDGYNNNLKGKSFSLYNQTGNGVKNQFLEIYYELLKYLRASLRNLARAGNPQANKTPYKQGGMVKF